MHLHAGGRKESERQGKTFPSSKCSNRQRNKPPRSSAKGKAEVDVSAAVALKNSPLISFVFSCKRKENQVEVAIILKFKIHSSSTLAPVFFFQATI
jgi:hypothetical protein